MPDRAALMSPGQRSLRDACRTLRARGDARAGRSPPDRRRPARRDDRGGWPTPSSWPAPQCRRRRSCGSRSRRPTPGLVQRRNVVTDGRPDRLPASAARRPARPAAATIPSVVPDAEHPRAARRPTLQCPLTRAHRPRRRCRPGCLGDPVVPASGRRRSTADTRARRRVGLRRPSAPPTPCPARRPTVCADRAHGLYSRRWPGAPAATARRSRATRPRPCAARLPKPAAGAPGAFRRRRLRHASPNQACPCRDSDGRPTTVRAASRQRTVPAPLPAQRRFARRRASDPAASDRRIYCPSQPATCHASCRAAPREPRGRHPPSS